MASGRAHGRRGGAGLGAVALAVLLDACIVMAPAESASGPAAGTTTDASPTLRQAAEQTHRHIGAAISTRYFDEPNYEAVAARQFDSITPENEMKWESIEPRENIFAFQGGDALVALASESAMRVRGHTLVWLSLLASWAKAVSGEALHAAMIHHVKSVVGHYKGRIAQWDVVNEALADGSSGTLRADSPFTSLGPRFIDDAFSTAHEADPDAILFYNDYEIEGQGAAKTEAALQLVKRLKDAGVPIGGVGFQMHVDPRHWPTDDDIRANFERFTALGVAVEITEMDVPVGEIQGTLEQKLARQKEIARGIVAACVAVAQCTGVTVWGFTDAHSWLNDAHWGALRGTLPHYPLPFDAEVRPKPMFFGILDAFRAARTPATPTHAL